MTNPLTVICVFAILLGLFSDLVFLLWEWSTEKQQLRPLRLLFSAGPILLLFALTGAVLRLLEEIFFFAAGGTINLWVIFDLSALFDIAFWLGLGVMTTSTCLFVIAAKRHEPLQQ